MRRQTPLGVQLYNYLYPRPSENDPSNFQSHLSRFLIPEVRIEVATYYGDLNSTEAKYPGLNYCHPPHRMRLGRFKHHRRLFEAFENLELTSTEIQEFCAWEGTKWARERYEKDENVKVRDTTGDEIGPWVDRRPQHLQEEVKKQNIMRKTDISVIVEEAPNVMSNAATYVQTDGNVDEPMNDRVEGLSARQSSLTENAPTNPHISWQPTSTGHTVASFIMAPRENRRFQYNPDINDQYCERGNIGSNGSMFRNPLAQQDPTVYNYVPVPDATSNASVASSRAAA